MTDSYTYDRGLVSGSNWTYDRLVNVAGFPVASSVGAPQEGVAVTVTGTGFSASGNSVFAQQGSAILPLGVAAEGTTSITTNVINAAGIYLTAPVSIYVVDASGNQSNALTVTILPATGTAVYQVTQEFLGDVSTRISGQPDLTNFDEIRIKNVVGGAITDVTLTGQGAFRVVDGVTSFDAAIFDGTILGPFATQTIINPVTTGTVPNIFGLSQMVAMGQVIAAGFSPMVLSDVNSATVPLGFVAAQFPAAGTALTLGGVVELTISLGLTGVIVPILTGQKELDAEAIRQFTGLTGRTYHYIDGINSGFVINQSVAPGTVLNVGDAVDIVVSSNKASNVIGLILQDAEAVLTASNLTYDESTFVYAYDASSPQQTVLAQSPIPDAIVAPGAQVILTLSLGPPPIGRGITPTKRRSAMRFRQ